MADFCRWFCHSKLFPGCIVAVIGLFIIGTLFLPSTKKQQFKVEDFNLLWIGKLVIIAAEILGSLLILCAFGGGLIYLI